MRTGFLLLIPLLAVLPLLLARCDSSQEPQAPAAQDAKDPAPRVRLCLSGFMQGALEPCGCASGQLGGLARRSFHLLNVKDYDLLIEGGNLIAGRDDNLLGGGTPLDREKMLTALDVLSWRHYDALGIGSNDLELPYDDLSLYLAAATVPVVSSDLLEKETKPDAPWPGKAFVERDLGKVTVRIASFTMHKPAEGAGPHFRLLPPGQAWTRAMRDVKSETYRVLLVHALPDEVRQCAHLTPAPDLIVGITAAVHEPPSEAESVAGVPIVFPGIRGRMLLDVALARMRRGPAITQYRIVKLEGSPTAKGAMEDHDTKARILQHRHQVEDMKILEEMADQIPTTNGASYVGSQACKTCHAAAFEAWEKSKHAHAYETLVQARKLGRYEWPITAYPDCISCHTVGYRRQSGFFDAAKTPELEGVGCEQCHGPGSKHKDNPANEKMALSHADRTQAPKVCLQCHNFEQSPTFEYGDRWKAIQHGK